MLALPDDPRIDELLVAWCELRDSGSDPRPEDMTDDPGLLAALVRAIAEFESGEDGLGIGQPRNTPNPVGVPGRYSLLGEPLRGGMGEVYRARDLEIEGRVVAYKVMRTEGEPTPHAIARFYREARITDKVRQPGVVPIYARLDDGSGRPAYAMEWVEGKTLGEVREGIETGEERGERAGEILRRFQEACRIVGVAHARGIIHGDLNSKNILLIENRQATRIVDWGSAVEVGTGDVSRPNHPVAPGYRDPALAPGEPPTQGSDIYALGVGLGKLAAAFEAGGITIIEGRKSSSAMRSLRAIARKAASSGSEGRYPDADSLAADLERFLSNQRVHADRAEPLTERAWRWASRHREAVTASIVLAPLCLASLAGIAYIRQEARRSRQTALSSQFGEITAICAMLQRNIIDERQDGADQIAVVKELVDRSNQSSDELIASVKILEERFSRDNEFRARAASERQAEIEKRLNSGLGVLDMLIEEYPEKARAYRSLLSKCYVDLGKSKLGTLANGKVLAAHVGETLAGKFKDRAGTADAQSALTLYGKALSLLPPSRRDLPDEEKVWETYRNAHLGRMVSLMLLARYTEALQSHEVYLGTFRDNAPPEFDLRQVLVKAAETEQQWMPWSKPPAADHAKAVAMADYLAAQRGVSDAAVFNAACACSLASTDLAADANERSRRADRAVVYLRRIAEKGYFHGFRLYPPPITDTLKELKTDYALDPLRGRADFKALVEQAAAGKPKKGS